MSGHHGVEVFNEEVFRAEADHDGVGEVMVAMTPQLSHFLGAIGDKPRTAIWLRYELDATIERLMRLQQAGFIKRAKGWSWLWCWERTEKGAAWYRVWSEEMARRRRSSARGPSWAEGEEPQPGDQVIIATEIASNIPLPGGGVMPGRALPNGMNSALRIVPHDPVARDVPWVPPEDMVCALGLLEEGAGVSLQYLVGVNTVGTNQDRMAAIVSMLVGQGHAVREGLGWARTMRGTRMHQTWVMEAAERAKAKETPPT